MRRYVKAVDRFRAECRWDPESGYRLVVVDETATGDGVVFSSDGPMDAAEVVLAAGMAGVDLSATDIMEIKRLGDPADKPMNPLADRFGGVDRPGRLVREQVRPGHDGGYQDQAGGRSPGRERRGQEDGQGQQDDAGCPGVFLGQLHHVSILPLSGRQVNHFPPPASCRAG